MNQALLSLVIDHVVDLDTLPKALRAASPEERSEWIRAQPDLVLWLLEEGVVRATLGS